MASCSYDVAVLGSINTDFAFSVAEFPKPGETLLSRGMRSSPGGKGSNQAVASARMAASVAMLGAIGEDDRGAAMRRFLDSEAVDTSRVVSRAHAPTGLAAIFVHHSGENLIVVDQGANGLIDSENIATDLPAATYYLAQLETPIDAIVTFFKLGKANGARCVLNAAPADLNAKALFRLCDVIIVNEPELSTYAGTAVANSDVETIAAAVKKLLSHDDQTMIVTRGKRGAIAVRRGAKLVVEAHAADAADTTGAGDCFCGTLVAALAKGMALAAAINRANAAAALAVRRSGAADALPTAAEVDEFLAVATDGKARLGS